MISELLGQARNKLYFYLAGSLSPIRYAQTKQKMNKIRAIFDNSDYEIYDEFLNFQIDGYWLDEKLDEHYPGNMYKGLVPTLLFCLEDQNERDLVWKRIYPGQFNKEVCPILMCPDDCDFSCTIIVAEIENCGNTIRWHRLGIDESKIYKPDYKPEKIGTAVTWFEKISSFKFYKKEYKQMIKDFEKQYQKDEIQWKKRRKI